MIHIELKSINVSQAQSQETHAYTAKLYADGRYIANIGNDGHGGADEVYKLAPGVTWADYEAVAKRVVIEHPKDKLFDDSDTLFDASLEGVCHGLVGEFLIARAVSRLLKSKVVYFKDGLPPVGQCADLYAIKVDPKKGQTMSAGAAAIKARHPQAYILNEQSQADAITAYKRTA